MPIAGVLLAPTGGDHDVATQNCGVHDAPVGTWTAVHSFEHGAVWITYAPGIPADDVAKLTGVVTGHDQVLVSPFPDQSSPIALTVWGPQLSVGGASDPRVETVAAKYENGPQAPELGAPYSGGVGEPTV